MLFVDASAIVAILSGEPDAGALLGRIRLATERATSAIAVYESTLAVRRIRSMTIEDGGRFVLGALAALKIAILPVEAEDAPAALSVFARYGKGEGHPARLNMGDCFALGMAERRAGRLLFKGGDFAAAGVTPGTGGSA